MSEPSIPVIILIEELQEKLRLLIQLKQEGDLLQSDKNTKINAVLEHYEEPIKQVSIAQSNVIDEIVVFYAKHRKVLTGGKGNRVVLYNGTLDARKAESLVVDNKKVAMRRIRRWRLVKILTKSVEREIMKTTVKNYAKKFPRFLLGNSGMRLVVTERLTINLPEVGAEYARTIKPLNPTVPPTP
jgi:phage host-nuclease inhibitor protein Gam